jgi:hypothetical protein
MWHSKFPVALAGWARSITFRRAFLTNLGGPWLYFAVLLVIASLVLDGRAAVHLVAPPLDPGQEADSLVKAFADAQNGDEIVLQKGTYRITPFNPAGQWGAPLKLINRTNITVRGLEEGVEILGDGQGESILIAGCSGVRFDKIGFRSNNAPVMGDWLYSIIMLYAQNEKLTFENCSFRNFGNHGISQLYGVKQSTDVVIRNCFFADGGDRIRADGAAISGIGSRWLIESNRIERCYIGFEIEGPWGTNQNIIVRKNAIMNTRGIGIVVFPTSGKSSDFSDIEISDNMIKDAVRDVPQMVFPVGILIGGGERIRVVRNTIDVCDNSGILVHANWADLRDSVIAENTINTPGVCGVQVYEFQGYKASNIIVRSNIISTAGQTGIRVAGSNIHVQGNRIENSGWMGDFAGVEVQNSGSTRDVRIEGNSLRNRGTTYQDYGICVRPGAAGTVIGPNFFRDNVVASILDEGTNTVIQTMIMTATLPSWELGSTVKIFAAPSSRGQVQTSDNLTVWTSVYPFQADRNGEGSVLVTADMIMIGRRYYRAVH